MGKLSKKRDDLERANNIEDGVYKKYDKAPSGGNREEAQNQ